MLGRRLTATIGGLTLSPPAGECDTTEPGAWQVTATDATARLKVAGGVGLGSYASSRATSGVTTSFDDLLAVTP